MCGALNGNRYTNVKLVKGTVDVVGGGGGAVGRRGYKGWGTAVSLAGRRLEKGSAESLETEREGYILGEDPNCISRDMNGRLTSNLRLRTNKGGGWGDGERREPCEGR